MSKSTNPWAENPLWFIGPYSIGTIKSFRGHEGEPCLQGTLLKDGKKVAEWSDDSWGGPMRLHFKDRAMEADFRAQANAHPYAVRFRKEMEEKYGVDQRSDYTDFAVGEIASEINLDRRQRAQLKRWCAKYTVFRLPGDKEGTYQTLTSAYSPQVDAALMAKHPDATILNRQFA